MRADCSAAAFNPAAGGTASANTALTVLRSPMHSVNDSIEKLDTRLRARNQALAQQVDALKQDVDELKKAAGK